MFHHDGKYLDSLYRVLHNRQKRKIQREREKKGEKETKQKSLLAVDRPFCCSLSFHLEKCFFNGDLWKRDREEKTTPAEQKQSETSAY